jgi:hypothetical protein
MTRLRGARALSVPGWGLGVVQDAEPGTLAPGTLAEGENFAPTPAGRLRVRGGSRILQTLKDDQATPAEVAHVCAIRPFTAVGALAIGWSDVQNKHYAWRLTADMAFSTGAEGTSRHDLTAAPSTRWNNASSPAKPIMAEVWEKMFLVDATKEYASRNTLLSLTNAGVIAQPSFQFGAGPAAALKPYCCEEYNGVLFTAGYGTEDAGDGDRPEMIRHSFLGKSPDAADGFDKDAWLLLGAKGARVTALRRGRGILIAAKKNELYRITGFGRAYAGWQYQVEQIFNTQGLGAANPDALRHAEGFWWGIGGQGPFRTDGFSVDSLVGPRKRDWRGIDQLENAWVAYHPERRLVLFGLHPAIASTGRSSSYPWTVWVWDVDREVWQPDWKFGADFFACAPIATESAQGPTASPSAPSTSGQTTSGYTASWTNGDTTAETEFWEKEGSGGTWSLVTVLGAGVASYARTGRTNHTEYFWRVRHRKNGIHSAFTADTSAKTLIAAPGLAATMDASFVELTITQNAGGTDITLQRSPSGAGTWTTIETFTAQPAGTFTHFDAPGDGTWDYRARSSDASWSPPDSDWSQTVTVTVGGGGGV